MNLTGFLADLCQRLRYTVAPAAATTTRLTAFLNETQRDLLAMPGIERLRDDVLAVTAPANQAFSGLSPAVARIRGITDRLNNHKLRQVPLPDLRIMDPSQNFVGGYPLRYAVVGERQVQIQPAAATGLWAVSTSASDTSQNIYLETVTTGGYPYLSGATNGLNGLTRVPIGFPTQRTDHIEVAKFYMSVAALGYVSLYDAATLGNELARIEPGKTFARYLTVAWHPIQTQDSVMYVDYSRTIFDLVNGFDEPLIPTDFHWVMLHGALMKEYEFIDDTRFAAASAIYEQGQMKLKAFVLNDGDRIASLRPLPMGWSPLGSRYPAENPSGY